jgi:ribosomal protein S18 acetylase RimI-like enzyme
MTAGITTIRPATRDDIHLLAEFQQKLARETENFELDKTIATRGMNAMFDDPSKGKYFIAEYNGERVGCHSITFEWSDWRNGTVWWLQSVYVIETHRKYGIFKSMFQNLQRMMNEDPSIRGLRLYVDKTNVRAQQVYQAMGMNGEHYSVFELMKQDS